MGCRAFFGAPDRKILPDDAPMERNVVTSGLSLAVSSGSNKSLATLLRFDEINFRESLKSFDSTFFKMAWY